MLLKKKVVAFIGKHGFYISGVLISSIVPFYVGYSLNVGALSEYYYSLALANIVSSLIVVGAAQHYYSSGYYLSNPVIRFMVALPILVAFLDLFLVAAIFLNVIEKISLPFFYSSEKYKKITFLFYPASSLLFVALALSMTSDGYLISVLKLAPSVAIGLSLAFVQNKILPYEVIPKRFEIKFFFSEVAILVLDSGVITLLREFASSSIVASAGFARSCSSGGFLIYNWSVINVRDENYKYIYYFGALLSFIIGASIYFHRMQAELLGLFFVVYFTVLPLVIGVINKSMIGARK